MAFFTLGIYSYGISFLNLLKMLFLEWEKHSLFIISFMVSFGLCYVYLKRDNFFAVFEHELTHLLWGLLFFKKPENITIYRSIGGWVEFGSETNFVILLAPYFSLTINFILIGLYYFIRHEFNTIFFIIYGASLGYHTSSTLKEFSLDQPDIESVGKEFSVIFLIFANILSYGITIAFVVGRGKLILEFLQSGLINFFNILS